MSDHKFLFDTRNRAALNTYHALKRSHGHKLSERMENNLIRGALEVLKDECYDNVFYPESSRSEFLYQLAKQFGVPTKLQKRSKYDIYRSLIQQDLMKDERISLDKAMDTMGNTFKINEIKGNQRWRFKEIMFESPMIVPSDRNLIIDDAAFSGSTIEAMLHHVPDADVFTLFSKLGATNVTESWINEDVRATSMRCGIDLVSETEPS